MRLIFLLLKIPGIIIATTLHEFTKAAVASILGNKTPRAEGRLTLNPFKHFEPIGFIIMLQTSFGWGKPVNVDAGYYAKNKNDILITYSAAIIANLVLAFVMCQIYKYLGGSNFNIGDGQYNIYGRFVIESVIWYNVSLAVFNIIPVYPLAGSKIFLSFSKSVDYFRMLQYEKILQLILLLLLFVGVVGYLLNPIIDTIINFFGCDIF